MEAVQKVIDKIQAEINRNQAKMNGHQKSIVYSQSEHEHVKSLLKSIYKEMLKKDQNPKKYPSQPTAPPNTNLFPGRRT